MRLEKNEHAIILSAVAKYAPYATPYLFGSRADNSRRGGDIDLLLIGKDLTLQTIRRLKIELKESLGDQKIDIIFEDPDMRTNFGKLIELDAIPL